MFVIIIKIGKLYASLKGKKEGAYKEKVLQISSAVLHSPAKKYKWKQWTNEQMLDAMDDVYSGTVGVNEAVCKHGVPPTTLKDRISGRVQHGTNSGPKCYLQ